MMISSATLSSPPVFCVCRSLEAYVSRVYILSKLVLVTRAIRKVTSDELLTKQA
jgi:hypothetical protein